MADGDQGARRDATLTLLVLVPAVVAAVTLPAPASPAAFVAGAVGALVLELLLSQQTARVRAVWSDTRVQLLAVVAALGGTALLVVRVGPWVVTVLLGGLCGYLALLAGVVWKRNR